MTESLEWTAWDPRRQSWPARLASGCRSSGFSPRWVPESARWLLTQGRVEEAKKYLFACAKLNGRPVGEDSLSQEVRVLTYKRVYGWVESLCLSAPPPGPTIYEQFSSGELQASEYPAKLWWAICFTPGSLCVLPTQYCQGDREAERAHWLLRQALRSKCCFFSQPGSEQSDHHGKGVAKTLILRPVPDIAAPTYLTVLCGDVVRGG